MDELCTGGDACQVCSFDVPPEWAPEEQEARAAEDDEEEADVFQFGGDPGESAYDM